MQNQCETFYNTGAFLTSFLLPQLIQQCNKLVKTVATTHIQTINRQKSKGIDLILTANVRLGCKGTYSDKHDSLLFTTVNLFVTQLPVL